MLGANTGPTAVETLLAALGSCVARTYAAHATARGIKIEELEVVDIEGKIDLNGFLQLKPIRAGIGGGGEDDSSSGDHGKEDNAHGLRE
ncbi:MAG: OsmC family protein [Thermoproteota archaeon]|nr:OsmC family protein [Thermoproteota archaeon]